MDTFIVRLQGVTAHFRDPRFNTGGVGNLPLRTLHAPPPCTVHGLLCAAKGGWVKPGGLVAGWRTDYESWAIDFQTCQMPLRKGTNEKLGTQNKKASPREREFLVYPLLSLLIIEGADADWFLRPVNPICLGRSEDLVVKKSVASVRASDCGVGTIANQCLPLGLGFGTIYPAPLYFDNHRIPIQMAPRTDARVEQQINSPNLMRVEETGEVFYIWDFRNVIR